MIVRLADPAIDAARVAEIYRPAVETSLASFEEVAPDATQMASRIAATLERTPWLVAEEGGSVIGYAYAAPHRERAGYSWSVEHLRRVRRSRGAATRRRRRSTTSCSRSCAARAS